MSADGYRNGQECKSQTTTNERNRNRTKEDVRGNDFPPDSLLHLSSNLCAIDFQRIGL
jgi:hypothetical protein